MSEIEELKQKIRILEGKISRQNQMLLDIPKDKYFDFVCGTTDIKNGIREGEKMFRFRMIDADDLKREKESRKMKEAQKALDQS